MFNNSLQSQLKVTPLSRLLCLQFDNQPFQGLFYRQDMDNSYRKSTFDTLTASFNQLQYCLSPHPPLSLWKLMNYQFVVQFEYLEYPPLVPGQPTDGRRPCQLSTRQGEWCRKCSLRSGCYPPPTSTASAKTFPHRPS